MPELVGRCDSVSDSENDDDSECDLDMPELLPRCESESDDDDDDGDDSDDGVPILQDRAQEDSSSNEDDGPPDEPESPPVDVAPTSPSRRERRQSGTQGRERDGHGRGCGDNNRRGYDPTTVPERAPGKRQVKKNHLKTTDHLYTQTSGHFQTATHRHVPNSGADYTVREPKGSRITLEYVHAMRAVVENHQARSDCHPKEVYKATVLAQQYHITKGLKIYGDRGREAAKKEMKQLDDMEVVKPKKVDSLTEEQKRNALPCLMFISEKNDGSIKGRCVVDGSKQEMDKDDVSAPTISTDALFITLVIDASEGRRVVTWDIPGAFLQAKANPGNYIKFTGEMVNILCQLNPRLYTPYVVTEKGRKVLYTEAHKAVYGMVDSAFLFWLDLSGFLEKQGFVMNPYDICCMNKIINGNQCTVVWHVDDIKGSHVEQEVLDELTKVLEERYAKKAPLKVHKGDVHEFLGMTIDLSRKGKVMISMIEYIIRMFKLLPEKMQRDIKKGKTTPATDYLFTVNEEDPELLDEKDRVLVHSSTARLLFLGKRARPDIQTVVAFLCTRVKVADVDDYKKLERVMAYLYMTLYMPLILGTDESGNIQWYKDGAHAVHPDMRGHTGLVMTLGHGAVLSASWKQKINTMSSTETETVAISDGMPKNMWTLYFIEGQGWNVKDNLLNEDNTSTMKLAKNGKRSSGKMTRHIKIRYFFVTDKIKKGEVVLIHCPTEEMIADYFTHPLQGKMFRYFRDLIMGISMADYEEYKLRYEVLARGRKELADAKRDRVNKAWAGDGPPTMTDEWKRQERKEQE